ncbi:MAG: tRNA 2-selenouridine(34) synthase MnmH [Acidobacteriota bacterium]|nr:tRNA 2-selenouridine(34) synthase MnmH [Acidobacteriota bacterium]MDH3530752.1 tRNA 2-selenouridine(34) synthase MnmH [Acidobacteriota bacterium]
MNRKTQVHIEEFRAGFGAVFDARSPVEFERGHIPGTVNFPLFTDEERAEVGICYKEKGRDAAVEMGFDLVGPRLGEMVRTALTLAPEKTVRIYCARGGMRSRNVAWLLETSGFEVSVLEGGYKSYRRWVRDVVSRTRSINILGGLTGTGKTRVLKALQQQGEQVLDLEGLANHRGSSFGGLGMPDQPTTQHYENLIADRLDRHDAERQVWIESESGRVGRCWVPEELFAQMKIAPVVEIVRSLEERLDILTEMYGETGIEELVAATMRIEKNLGGERTKAAIDLIRGRNLHEASRIILDYYDRSYSGHLKRRPVSPRVLDITGLSDHEAATLLKKRAPSLLPSLSSRIIA